MRVSVFVLSAAILITSAASSWAQDVMRTITVSGQGQVFAEPDMATVRVGVTHEDSEARQAMERTAENAAQVLERLESTGIEARDMQTGSISLRPVWSNRTASAQPARITGFVAEISVTVRVRDLAQLGSVLDAVIRDGANELGGIQFGLQDPGPLMEQARRAAVADARAKAETLADAAGVDLGVLQSLSEQGAVARPQPMMMEAAMRDAGVPIAAGEVALNASVSMVYQIAQ